MSDTFREQFDNYIGDLFAQEDETLRWIRAETERNGLPMISVQPYDGYLLQWLMRAVGARRAVEIGTLGGYSGTWIARALPADGKLYTLELSPKHAQVARAAFDKAGLGDQVEVIVGSAVDSLKTLAASAPFDLVFIDADKGGYPHYLAWAVEHLRPGGIVAAHNAYRHGAVLNPENEDDRAIDQFNRAIAHEPRLNGMIIPLGDGMAVGVKR